MPAFFGKKRKNKQKEETSLNEGGDESPPQRLRFNNRGQTVARFPDPVEKTSDSNPSAELEQPSASPPARLRFENKSGATVRQKRRNVSDEKKKLGKRRSDLGGLLSAIYMPFEDPDNLKPQAFKVGYLYKREGNDYKTKRHFRLSKDSGLKIYKNEQDKITSQIEEICLDFMRCELQVGAPDIVAKDPRYFFCLKSDDLSAKSWFLAAESDYERKKWMVSLAWHIENHCQPSVTDVSSQTKEYLGYANLEDQQDEFNPSVSISDYDSDSDDVYIAGIERSPRAAPQIAKPVDDEIYGEFDPHLTLNLVTQKEIKDVAAAVDGMSLHEPRRSSLDRKTSTTHNIIPDLAARTPVNLAIAEEDEDDTYMAAADVVGGPSLSAHISSDVSSLSAPISLGVSSAPIVPQQSVEDENIYLDGYSLKSSSPTTAETPVLPTSRPPSFISSENYNSPLIDSQASSVIKRNSVTMTQPPIHTGPPLDVDTFTDEENLYVVQDELTSSAMEEEYIYNAPPTVGVDAPQPPTFAPPIPQRVPQNKTPVPLPPRNLPPKPPS